MTHPYSHGVLARVCSRLAGFAAPFAFSLAALAGPAPVLDTPANPDSIQEVRALLSYLNSIKGSHILAGQDVGIKWDGSNPQTEINYLAEHTGKKPALRSFDFMFLTDPNNVDSQKKPLQKVARDVTDWWSQGGLAAIQWHWKLGSPGHYDFYTTKNNGTEQGTDWDVEKGLTVGTPENTLFNKDIDLVASELLKLRDARIPILWRPFHEVGGNWFWWSAQWDTALGRVVSNPARFKRLWVYLYNRLTYKHGLNNLIWVWNPTFYGKNTLDLWYPGDQYVDMITLDVYPNNGTHPTYATDYKALHAYREGRKVVAMSENGPIPDIDKCFEEGAEWSYFCTWNGGFLMDATKSGVTADSLSVANNLNFLKKVYNHEKVLTLDEISIPGILNRAHKAPSLTLQPASATPAAGDRVIFSVLATGDAPLSYQWQKNGTDLPGATSRDLSLDKLSATNAGQYRVRITNLGGSVTSEAATLTLASGTVSKPASVLTNISSRAETDTRDGGEKTLTAGFVIGGTGSKKVLIRVVGPTLSQWGVPSLLSFPSLRLINSKNELLASNTNWTTAENREDIRTAAAKVGAFELSDPYASAADSKMFGDSALLVSLPAGSGYTVQAVGADGSPGVALIEVYDADQGSSSYISNLSARGLVDKEGKAFNVGFVVSGSAGKYMLIRAIGPTLKGFGLANAVNAVTLQLMDKNQLQTAFNDGWDKEAAMGTLIRSASMALSGWAPDAGSKDAALLRTQPAELFTAVVQPATGATAGIGLVEVYDAESIK